MAHWMNSVLRMLFMSFCFWAVPSVALAAQDPLQQEVAALYDQSLDQLFKHFHANPELSFVEVKTAARMAQELSALGYEVHSGIARTGVVALLHLGNIHPAFLTQNARVFQWGRYLLRYREEKRPPIE